MQVKARSPYRKSGSRGLKWRRQARERQELEPVETANIMSVCSCKVPREAPKGMLA
jgi:hypothetical protein